MTTGSDTYTPSQQQTPPPKKKSRNVVGLIALITAIVGTIFAVIPGALILGWILLPVAFILSIVSLFLKHQKRGQGIAALIISIVGTIIGAIVFFAVVATAVDESFNEDVEIQSPVEGGEVEESVVDEDAAADDGEEGTRGNPLDLGTTITESDWEVTVNSVDLNATDAVLAENPLNDDPAEGHGYILANVTATYIGDDASGDTLGGVRVEFVSSAGNSFDSTANMVIAPDYFNRSETLYEGASTTGNFAFEVPMDDVANGHILLSPSMFGDGVFFNVQ
ncbi:DUF308 domain-containing protein [Yaniella halotolerans]|uniref:DUF308 domain-containing protein n=1 Tax=Yaniella halotolerans TaxID=225453 RepID=UPI0003B5C84D|nr:DUF308 domain-containing protein [Yaniella halotolerans]